jgi:hypothetical protein
MPAPQPKNHIIDRPTAAAMTRRHRQQNPPTANRPTADGEYGGMFMKDQVLTLLQQEGAKFLRFYYGRNAAGGSELILVAADEDGNDITALTLDGHYPCPPFCPDGGSDLLG